MAKRTVKHKARSRYGRVPIASVNGHRRGKHHDVIGGILDELETVGDPFALKIPLADLGGVTLANVRSAVHRAAKAKNLNVETASDRENLYVWKSREDH